MRLYKKDDPNFSRTYDFGWGIYNSDGFTRKAQYVNLLNDTTLQANKAVYLRRTLNFGKNYPDGIYFLRPICRETSGNGTLYPCHDSGRKYIRAEIKGDSLFLSKRSFTDNAIDGITAWVSSKSNVRRLGSLLTVYVQVFNNSLMTEQIPLYLWAYDYDGSFKPIAGTTINVPQGSNGSTTITFYPTRKTAGYIDFCIAPRGDYASLNVSKSYYCKESIYVGHEENFTDPYGLKATCNVIGANENKVIDGTTFKVQTTMTNNNSNTYHNYIIAKLYPAGNDYNDYDPYASYIACSMIKEERYLYGNYSESSTFIFDDLKPGWYRVKIYYVDSYVKQDEIVYNEKYAGGTLPYWVGPIPGDVNADKVCNAADVTALYNWILNNDASAIVNGDQNKDGVINAGDVTTVYNIILGN